MTITHHVIESDNAEHPTFNSHRLNIGDLDKAHATAVVYTETAHGNNHATIFAHLGDDTVMLPLSRNEALQLLALLSLVI